MAVEKRKGGIMVLPQTEAVLTIAAPQCSYPFRKAALKYSCETLKKGQASASVGARHAVPLRGRRHN